ncbi:hypothetical protein [Agromyces bauzanensis]|uniref:Uncharacterized protein n=1 Tax=Agromyces bauzanensis TaxID=1308924 RepID=A0A917PJM1_9MICO|nr:hypothetical protein [Agromyces bauzanensis]GGJ81281.1 hypothetical protein GCM10011372_19580 [Agromyces bauzanensis]
MTTRIAAPVIVAVSLAVLMSGCAGAATAGGGVRDDVRTAENAAVIGLARGHVIVRDDLSPERAQNRITAGSVEQAVQAEVSPPWTAEARRELHAQAASTAQGFSGEAMRELKSGAPLDVDDDLSPLGGPR